MKTERSQALEKKYDNVVPGGVHSNFRTPVYFTKAQGSRLWDVDGNEYIDCIANNGACILGHGDPDVEVAVIDAVKQGLTVALESELSLTVAKQLHDMIPSAEEVRFANTGTEAVMKALMIARAFTGKEKIIKVEGAYHGWFDEAQVSVHPDPAVAGTPTSPQPVIGGAGVRQNTLDTVLVVPFNNLNALEQTLDKHKGEIAAMIMEPVIFNSGCILPQSGYLEEVRRLTKKYGVVLIFDEIITGFRLAPGGAQERFGVVPDISTFAKAIANGYPLSAVVGRRDMMELTRPGGTVLYGGTYNGQHAALAAASACLTKLKDGSVQKHLQALTDRLSEVFNEHAKVRNISARLEQCGGQFQVYFTDHDITDYRTAAEADRRRFEVFHRAVSNEGIWMKGSYLFHHGVTYAHSEEDLEKIIAAFDKGLDAVKEIER
ncbi:MAG: aminotransferase class III-fold pyridoxal phosphate-dependent enzyme [Nitrospiraceae bacterium]|nr:aminotransferase class III-fold pyridoxal phosphate-dependent enzyme [Nitrospiraceae bacterium]